MYIAHLSYRRCSGDHALYQVKFFKYLLNFEVKPVDCKQNL